jgi:hypothetical protein
MHATVAGRDGQPTFNAYPPRSGPIPQKLASQEPDMRTIEELIVERIGDDLCLVFKTDGSRFRGILGRLDPSRLEELAAGFSAAKQGHFAQEDGAFRHVVYKTG